MYTSNQKSNQNLKAAVLVAILALLGANVYQFVNNRSLQKDNMTKETEIVELDKAKAELEKQYQESVAELNTMKTVYCWWTAKISEKPRKKWPI